MTPRAEAGRATGRLPWQVCDPVTRLRIWGTERTFELSLKQTIVVGSAATCDLRLRDPAGGVAKRHAVIVRRDAHWMISAAGATTSLAADGLPSPSFTLLPGMEIGIGNLVLVAESERIRALAGVLSQLLGGGSHGPVVDRALRAVRTAATARATLVLAGSVAGDLLAAALQIHRAISNDAPFVIVNPRTATSREFRDLAQICRTAAQGMAAAQGGTMCVHTQLLPADFQATLARGDSGATPVNLVLCATNARMREAERLAMNVLTVVRPRRRVDLLGVMNECADEIEREEGVHLTDADRQWILRCAKTLRLISVATRRLAALRRWRFVMPAAKSLGIHRVSLMEWLDHRPPIPGGIKRQPQP